MFRELFYCCAYSSFGNRIAHRFQKIVRAIFNCIFPFCMNYHGALFSLFPGMAAYFYKGSDNPIKAIYLII